VRRSSLRVYRCPACRGRLELSREREQGEVVRGFLACACGRSFAVRDSVPDLVHPESLLPSDEESRRKYDQGAEDYDVGLNWLFESFYEDENAVRRRMVDRLDALPGHRVLEVGCGTGRDSRQIVERIRPGGALFLQDLSQSMIAIARQSLAGAPIELEFHLSNALHLPFGDGEFDAVYHFGGINTFGDKRRALREMTRVVHPGGKVVVGDESAAPWLRRRLNGRMIMNANPLYRHVPPLASLPENARDVSLHWVLGNAFYLIEYVVGEGPPRLNADLPIPGKRGGTLRSRYYGSAGR
jgi:ubiquinone/menaquinone biosynthesis C-methylase UbiE